MSDFCEFCKCSNIGYHIKYDAYFCVVCKAWQEKICNDSNCGFCNKRPLTAGKMVKKIDL